MRQEENKQSLQEVSSTSLTYPHRLTYSPATQLSPFHAPLHYLPVNQPSAIRTGLGAIVHLPTRPLVQSPIHTPDELGTIVAIGLAIPVIEVRLIELDMLVLVQGPAEGERSKGLGDGDGHAVLQAREGEVGLARVLLAVFVAGAPEVDADGDGGTGSAGLEGGAVVEVDRGGERGGGEGQGGQNVFDLHDDWGLVCC